MTATLLPARAATGRSKLARRTAYASGPIAFALYAATAPRGIGWDDAGELAAGVAKLGIVHRPGYPLYVLLGHVFVTLFPVGGIALRINLWSAAASAAAVLVAAILAARRTDSPIAAATAACLLATSGLFWSQAAQASVYPLCTLSILLIALAGDRFRERPTAARLALLAAAAGFATVSSSTGWIYAPFALALLHGSRERRPDRKYAIAAAAFLLPWLTALYIPFRANSAVWPNAVRGTGEHWWQALYGLDTSGDGPFKVGLDELLRHTEKLAMLGVVELSVAAIVLVPLGLWILRRDRVFVCCLLIPGTVFALLTLSTSNAFPFLYLPLFATLAVASGCGAPAAARWIRSRAAPLGTIAAGVLAVSALTSIVAGIRYLSTHDPDASPWAHSVLRTSPRGATLAAPWPAFAPLRAIQEVAHERPDIRVQYLAGLEPSAANLSTPGVVVALGLNAPPRFEAQNVIPLGPLARVQRKGMTGIMLASQLLSDPQYDAHAYRVLSHPAHSASP